MIGLSKAQAVDKSKLSQIPFAIFDMEFALAGAITKISDSVSAICSGLYSFMSNCFPATELHNHFFQKGAPSPE